jgi:hypothetical protein
MSMVKTSKSALRTVISNKRKWLIRLSQKAIGDSGAACFSAHAVNKLLGLEQAPYLMHSSERNVETS